MTIASMVPNKGDISLFIKHCSLSIIFVFSRPYYILYNGAS